MKWRVTFLIEEQDEIREVIVDADSEDAAKAEAERQCPWEAETSASTVALPMRTEEST